MTARWMGFLVGASALIAACGDAPIGTCGPGLVSVGGACVKVDECATDHGGCAPEATCTNTNPGRTCTCPTGFDGDGTQCFDVDECLTENTCSPLATCTNTVGGYSCACREGYQGDGRTCVDTDECATDNGGCGPVASSTCTNEIGSYACGCAGGYATGESGSCEDVDECLTDNGGCGPVATSTCANEVGSYACGCAQGYAKGENGSCEDVDECATDNGGCGPTSSTTCANAIGSYVCGCAEGYAKGESGTCEDVDECMTDQGACDANATCTNLPGTHRCVCNVGWAGTGLVCEFAQETALTSGAGHSCAIRPDGSLWCWGRNTWGQLGDGTFEERATPVPVQPGTTWLRVAAGRNQTCGVRLDGSLWCWGAGAGGALGNGSNTTVSTPVRVGVENVWLSVAIGPATAACAVRTDGRVFCWGDNGRSPVEVISPVPSLSWKSIAVGGVQTARCGVLSDDSLWCWGNNTYGLVGLSGYTGDARQVTDGVAMVSMGSMSTCIVKTDGALWCWGYNFNGVLGIGVASVGTYLPRRVGSATWRTVSVGSNATACGVTSDGETWCWGYNSFGQVGAGSRSTTGVSSPSRVVEAVDTRFVAPGGLSTCAMRSDGSVSCWGSNDDNALGDGSPVFDEPVRLSDGAWRSVSAGTRATAAVRADGTLWNWGDLSVLTDHRVQEPERLGNGSAWEAVDMHSRTGCAIDSSGVGSCWGSNAYGTMGNGTMTSSALPVPVTSGRWLRMASGQRMSCGIQTDRSLWCWGALDPETTHVSPLTRMAPGATWSDLSVGGSHACAVATDGSLFCWGSNANSELGLGTETPALAPQRVGDSNAWTGVSAGSDATCGTQSDGSLWCWGSNSNGQMGDGTQGFAATVQTPKRIGTAGWAQVAMGSQFACAVGTDGSLWCWGSRSPGTTGYVPSNRPAPTRIGTDQDWASISVGSGHACGLKTDDSLWCLGSNSTGQIGNGQSWQLAPVAVTF